MNKATTFPSGVGVLAVDPDAHLPVQLRDAAKLVREAAALIEKADQMLVGFRHFDPHSDRTSWPAEDGIDVAALRSCFDTYHFYIRNGVRVPVDKGLAA